MRQWVISEPSAASSVSQPSPARAVEEGADAADEEGVAREHRLHQLAGEEKGRRRGKVRKGRAGGGGMRQQGAARPTLQTQKEGRGERGGERSDACTLYRPPSAMSRSPPLGSGSIRGKAGEGRTQWSEHRRQLGGHGRCCCGRKLQQCCRCHDAARHSPPRPRSFPPRKQQRSVRPRRSSAHRGGAVRGMEARPPPRGPVGLASRLSPDFRANRDGSQSSSA